MKYMKKYERFLNNYTEKKFVIDNDEFQLFLDNDLVSWSKFNIRVAQAEELINQKYVLLTKLETDKEFRGKGFAKYLLEKIFDYVKNELQIDYISLTVLKNNEAAINLYLGTGFEIFRTFDDYYVMLKKL